MKRITNKFFISFLILLSFFSISISVSAQSYYKLGKKELKKGEYSIAVSYFTKHLKSSEDYKAYINRGIAFTMMNQFEPALSDFNKSIQLKPDFELSYYNRGIAYSKSGKLEEAIKDFQKVIELKPNYTDAYLELGKVYFELNKPEDAKRIFTNLIRIDSSLSAAFLNRGIANLRLQDYENALKDFGHSRNLNSYVYSSIVYSIIRDKLRYEIKIGVNGENLMYESNSAHEEAERLLNFARSKDVDNGTIKGTKQQLSEFYKILGFALHIWGGGARNEYAMKYVNRAIDLNPTDPQAYLFRGIIEYNEGGGITGWGDKIDRRLNAHILKSINDFDKAIQLEPDLTIAYFLKGNINFRYEKNDSATSNYLFALQNNLNADAGLFYDWILMKYSFDEIFKNIAYAYQQSGNDSEAEIYLNKQKESDNQLDELRETATKQYSQAEEKKSLALAEEEYRAFIIKKDQLSHFEAYEFMENFIINYPGSQYLTEIETYFNDLKKKLNEKAALLKEGEEYDLVFLYNSGYVIPRSVSIKNLIDKQLNVIVKPGTAIKATGNYSDKVVTFESKYRLPASGTLKVNLESAYLTSKFHESEYMLKNFSYESEEDYYGVYAVSSDLYSFMQASTSKVDRFGYPNLKVVQIGILAITEYTTRSQVKNRMTYRKKLITLRTTINNGYYTDYFQYEDVTVTESEIIEAKQILDSLGIKNNL